MEWDQEIVLQLLNEYRKKEILWNPRHSAYYNKIKKEDAWRELAQKFEKSSEEVKKKIESLKGSYRREKVRAKKSMGTGKGRHEIYKSKCFAYESLQFLDDKDEPRKTLSNLQTVSDDEEIGNEILNESLGEEKELEKSPINEESMNSQTTEQLADETQNKEFKFPKKRTKQRKTDEDPIITEALGYLRQTTAGSQQRKDQLSLFGDYIAHKLRSFDNRLCAIAQNRISNVLFELEMNFYQNPASHTNVQSPFPYSNFYQHRTETQYLHNQIDNRNPAFNDQFSRFPISAHRSTSPSDLSHSQQTSSFTPQNSNNQPSTSSTPVSYISSPYPSPQENESPLSNFQYSSDTTNDSQRT